MALFVVRHQHQPDHCPAEDPYAGAGLLNHLSQPQVREPGVIVQGEAVVQGEHTLYLIVEASDEARLHRFMEPFRRAGSVDIYPASTCARVVAAGGCVRPMPDEVEQAMDPEEACQRAIESGLVLHRAHPLNGETPIPALIGALVPNPHFYVRNHFAIPRLDPVTWRLQVGGLVERPLSLSLRDLHNMRSQTLMVTLECAGNGRSMLNPRVDGEQWRLGAVSTAEWTGVPLSEVLDRAQMRPAAREVVFRGADRGSVEGRAQPIRFERSLTPEQARETEALLAYAMNGEALPMQHGFPLRLVVPGWYGVASVKWLTQIEVTDTPLTAYYQTEKYWYEWPRDGQLVREPVTVQRVRALITEPLPDQTIEPGELTVRGVAWSGAGAIERVEVSTGGGPWEVARLVGARQPHSWQRWELITQVAERGTISLRARATDTAGRTQPDRPDWNRLGYGSNAVQEVTVHVS